MHYEQFYLLLFTVVLFYVCTLFSKNNCLNCRLEANVAVFDVLLCNVCYCDLLGYVSLIS